MELIPTQDWMLLEAIEDKTELFMPDTVVSSKIATAASFKVAAIGPWESYIDNGSEFPVEAKEGDEVIIVGFASPFEYNRTKYVCCRAREVAFIVKKGAIDGH